MSAESTLSTKELEMVRRILDQEMILATGCTEPAAIALAAATAAKYLQEKVSSLVITASGNMIKNAMAAGIPGTNYTGIRYAAAIGAVGGNVERGLQVIETVTPEAYAQAEALIDSGSVLLQQADVSEKLYVDVCVKGSTRSARTVISHTHTNIVCIEENGKTIFQQDLSQPNLYEIPSDEIQKILSVAFIYKYATEIKKEDIPSIILKSMEANQAVSNEGLKNSYGLSIGKATHENMQNGRVGKDLAAYAAAAAAAGSDVRMAGAVFPVVTNSGSGNQGIMATMAVVASAQFLNKDPEITLRAVILSHLISIYIHSKFGRLSALCGATVAGVGASCGITYLLGGSFTQITYAIHTMIGDVTGMLCDGAKADCALKIHTCVYAAVQAAYMAIDNKRVNATDGIVETDVEKTIDNFADLGNKGSCETDKIVLEMMLAKENA